MEKEELIKNIKEKLEINQEEILEIINRELQNEKKLENLVLSSFWELFHNETYQIKKILIPNIQRNYVQGNNKTIITKLIKDIFDALEDDNKYINLDIIYGINNEANFIPIDGQQRLTTLFLLYWYVFSKANKYELINEIDISYENKESSKKFFELLKDKEVLADEKGDILQKIQDSTKYYKAKWSKDITIQSALKTLEQIQNEYNERCKDSEYAETLCDILTNTINPKIYFRCKFLKAQEDDAAELYIKMNSRGKQLSKYEILKSQLENIAFKYLNNEEYIKLCSNFDNDWAESFFRKEKEMIEKDKDNNKYNVLKKVEENYYNFLKKFIMYYFLDNALQINYEKEINDFKKELIEGINIKFEDEGIYTIKRDFFEKLENIMKNIKFLYSNKPEENYLTEIINLEELWNINIDPEKRSIREELYFYAIIKFLENANCTQNINNNYELFENWIRVTRNYINSNYHIQIADKRKNDSIYFKIIKIINIMINKIEQNESHDILECIKEGLGEEEKLLSKTEKKWLKAEKAKAKIFRIDKDVVKMIDQDKYFNGVNYFLFDWIEYNENDEIKEEQVYALRNYGNIVNKIFEYKSEFLLQRALLTEEIYFERTFYVFNYTDNTNTWIAGLNEWNNEEDSNNISKKLKSFIDRRILKEDLNSTSVENILKNIIDNSSLNNADWRYYFIKNLELFNTCKQGLIEFVEDDDKEMYDCNRKINLIKTQRNSKHWDYLTKILEDKIIDMKLDNVEVRYVGKTGSNKAEFKYEQNLKLEVNKNEYTFIRDIEGEYIIKILDDNEVVFEFDYNIFINNKKISEEKFNVLNSLFNNTEIEIIRK